MNQIAEIAASAKRGGGRDELPHAHPLHRHHSFQPGAMEAEQAGPPATPRRSGSWASDQQPPRAEDIWNCLPQLAVHTDSPMRGGQGQGGVAPYPFFAQQCLASRPGPNEAAGRLNPPGHSNSLEAGDIQNWPECAGLFSRTSGDFDTQVRGGGTPTPRSGPLISKLQMAQPARQDGPLQPLQPQSCLIAPTSYPATAGGFDVPRLAVGPMHRARVQRAMSLPCTPAAAPHRQQPSLEAAGQGYDTAQAACLAALQDLGLGDMPLADTDALLSGILGSGAGDPSLMVGDERRGRTGGKTLESWTQGPSWARPSTLDKVYYVWGGASSSLSPHCLSSPICLAYLLPCLALSLDCNNNCDLLLQALPASDGAVVCLCMSLCCHRVSSACCHRAAVAAAATRCARRPPATSGSATSASA